MRDSVISFRTSEILRKALKKISVTDRRTLSSVIENILHDYIERREAKQAAGEKRRYPRIKLSTPALVSGLDGAVHAGVVNDISLGGVNFSVPSSFPHDMRPDSRISVVFTLRKSEKPLTMQCSLRHVCSSDRKSIGASLIDADFHSYRVLQEYVTEMTPAREAQKDVAPFSDLWTMNDRFTGTTAQPDQVRGHSDAKTSAPVPHLSP